LEKKKWQYATWDKKSYGVSNVTCGLKAGIVEKEETTTARQRLSKHASVAIDTHTTLEELLEAVFSVWSEPRLYNVGQKLPTYKD
jgi:hypothetical protein